MSEPTHREGRRTAADRGRGDWRELLPSGGLVLLVLFLLVLGARLQVDERTPAPARAPSREPAPTRAEPPAVRPAAPEPGPSPPPVSGSPVTAAPSPSSIPEPRAPRTAPPPAAPGEGLLSERLASDPARLAGSGPGWTLQLLVACQPETAASVVRRAGGSPQLFVLPASLGGRACWRICWGTYADRDAAATARDLPASVGAGLDRPLPRPIAEVLP